MANVLSEPALPNCASRSEEVLLEKTAVPMSQLALAFAVKMRSKIGQA